MGIYSADKKGNKFNKELMREQRDIVDKVFLSAQDRPTYPHT